MKAGNATQSIPSTDLDDVGIVCVASFEQRLQKNTLLREMRGLSFEVKMWSLLLRATHLVVQRVNELSRFQLIVWRLVRLPLSSRIAAGWYVCYFPGICTVVGFCDSDTLAC